MTAKGGNFGAPADEGAAVTPSDTASVGGQDGARFLYVGGAGNLAVTLAGPGNTVVTLNNVLAGAWIPLRVTKVMATNTSATNIVAFW